MGFSIGSITNSIKKTVKDPIGRGLSKAWEYSGTGFSLGLLGISNPFETPEDPEMADAPSVEQVAAQEAQLSAGTAAMLSQARRLRAQSQNRFRGTAAMRGTLGTAGSLGGAGA